MKPQRERKKWESRTFITTHTIFWLGFFLFFLLVSGFYRLDVIVICLHSSPNQRVLTEDKVTGAVIDDPGGAFFFFFYMTLQKSLPLGQQDVSDIQERTLERGGALAQTQFTSIATSSFQALLKSPPPGWGSRGGNRGVGVGGVWQGRISW